MTGLYILGGILLLLLILLLLRVNLVFDMGRDNVINLRYGFLRIKLLPRGEDKRTKRKIKKAAKKAVNTADEAAGAKKKKPKITMQDILLIIKSAPPPIKYLLSRVRLLHLSVNIIVAGEDAAKTAIDYGKMSAYVHGGIAAVSNIISVQADDISIYPDYTGGKTEFHIHGVLCLRGYMLICALIMFFFIYIKGISENNSQGKRRMQNE